MRRRVVVAVLVAGGIAGVVLGRPVTAPAVTIRTAASTRIAFVLDLRMNVRGLTHYAAASGPPLSAAAVGRRFGLPLASIARVRRELARHGVRVTRSYPQRTELDAVATAGTLQRYLHVRFRDAVDGAGVRYHVPTSQPIVPARLSRWVDGVLGLDTRPHAEPRLLPDLTPGVSARAYDVAPLHAQGVNGNRQSLSILSYAPFVSDDVRRFDATFGISGPSPRAVTIFGGPRCRSDDTSDTCDGPITEANLDVQVARETAPGAQITVYEAPNSAAGELALLARFVADSASIGSYSWGYCDGGSITSVERSAVDKALAAAAARGKTLFVASGDSGAYDCQPDNFADHRLTVDFPADSPSAVAVGGTLLGVTADGSYLGEAGWVDPFANGGGGGGISPSESQPSWQRGIVPGSKRGLPDVAAAASPGSGWVIYAHGEAEPVGGTSAAAPFWAAAALLAEQYAGRSVVQSRCFMAPLLYALASTPQPYPPFHDVQVGGNRYYAATKGWDYATGLGSPDVYNLARDLASFLARHPGACRP